MRDLVAHVDPVADRPFPARLAPAPVDPPGAEGIDRTELAELEDRLLREANELGIGPMGFGGSTTLLGCKITHRNRVPASFFVSVSYMCWAFRRQGFQLSEGGKITRWLY